MQHSIWKRSSLAAAILLPATLSAQVSMYGFSESVGSYTALTEADGGLVLGEPTFSPFQFNNRAWVNNPFFDPGGQVTQGGYFNPAIGPGYPIGFDFTFNGDVFDVIGISNGGWISFGKSSDNLQAVWVYNAGATPAADPLVQSANGPTPNYKRNRVAGFGNGGLQQVDYSSLAPPGQRSSIIMATIGTAPERVCVIEWKDYGMSNDNTGSMNRVNFQIRLHEADDAVEVVMGPMNWVSILGQYTRTQIGLSGRLSDDFNGRKTVIEEPAFLVDWNHTVAATSNEDFCQFTMPVFGQPNGSGIPPVSGRTWRWAPPGCPPPAWPLSVTDITFDAAVAHWTPAAAGAYEYFLTTGNSPSGPEVASGIITDAEVAFEGLSAGTAYYVFVRSICDGEPGIWSLGVPFETSRGGVVPCNGQVILEDFCSQQYSVQEWLYVSADGAPLRLEFSGGFVGPVNGESFTYQVDGGATVNLPAGDLTGYTIQAAGGQLRLRLTTEAGACQGTDWYHAMEWRIGCKNCTDPLVNFTVGTVDCSAHEYFMNANVFQMGSAPSLVIENSLGLPSTTVSSTGNHSIGPFPAGEPIAMLAESTSNPLCYFQGAELVNEPCAIEDCGPTWYERCSGRAQIREWLLKGVDGPISVRFPPGYLGWDADVVVYDGPDELSPSTTIHGYPNNEVMTSTGPENLLLVRYVSSNYLDFACSLGNTEPLRFVAECAADCQPPVATFGYVDCSEPSTFQLVVNLTSLGSASGVTISNDVGVAATVVQTTGTHIVGPFPSGSSVQLQVQGDGKVCTIGSAAMSRDCTDMSVPNIGERSLLLYPNPNNGHFTLDMPTAITGRSLLRVTDLTGRVVHDTWITGAGRVPVELNGLSNGLYELTLINSDRSYFGKLSIQN